MDSLEYSDDLSELIKDRTIGISADVDKFELGSDVDSHTLSLRQNGFDDEKEMKRFIKSCELIIRKSPEYRLWTNYIRDVLGVTSCDLTKESHNECRCDIHHHPVSLYTIVKGIIVESIEKNEPFCSADIAVKVLELHFQNRVGFISLIKSVHEKYHNGFLQLPMQLVHGDYKYFIDNYCGYLEDPELEVINSKLAIGHDNCGFEGYWTSDHYIPQDIKGELE